MGIAHVQTVGRLGVRCFPLVIEVDVSPGLPSFTVVGLPDTVIQESKERIRSAIKNSGLTFPLARITVNLAPSHVRKEGVGFDVPIALGILAASQQIPLLHESDAFFGELGLEGHLKSTRGVLLFVLQSAAVRRFIPLSNVQEAALAPQALGIYGVNTLAEMVKILLGVHPLPITTLPTKRPDAPSDAPDFGDIYGQAGLKRMLEIAAAGHHNCFLMGPPGSGKTLLARAFPSILPPLMPDEQLEATQIQSIAGLLSDDQPIVTQRPFRAPHHSATTVAMLGGGNPPRPGEITLAHHGVLFLDECAEFSRAILEALRQPLEDRVVTVARGAYSVTFPANILLFAAMNPCPCGFKDDPTHACVCSVSQMRQYEKKLSGPILDRIDVHMTVPAVPVTALTGEVPESSKTIQARVMQARERQYKRYKDRGYKVNAALPHHDIQDRCAMEAAAHSLLMAAVEKWHLSVRGFHKVTKVAQTIADLADAPLITSAHIAEALHYRPVL